MPPPGAPRARDLPRRPLLTSSLASSATLMLVLVVVVGGGAPASACPFLLGQSAHAAAGAGAAPAIRPGRRLASAYPSPTEAYAGFLPGTLTSSLAAIAKTLAPQSMKATADRYLSAAAAWNVTAEDGVEGASPHASRLEAAISAVEASLAADKAGSTAPDTYDGAMPDGPLAFAEALFRKLMYPVPPSLFVRLAFHDCGTWNKAAAAVSSAGASGRGPSAGGCNGSIRYELARAGNYGLGVTWPVVNFGWKVLQHRYPGTFSTADAVAIAGAAGVRAAFGPVMHVGYGRVDAASSDPDAGPASNPQVGKDFSPASLADVWLVQYGLPSSSLCALMGAHTFGISSVSAPLGVFAPTGPLLFTNAYYRRVADGTAHFPVDNALAGIPETAGCVDAYAADQGAFFEGFAREYRGMTWWGQGAVGGVSGLEGGASEGEWREA